MRKHRVITLINKMLRPTGLVFLPAKVVVDLCQQMATLRNDFDELVAMRQLELQQRINELRIADGQPQPFQIH